MPVNTLPNGRPIWWRKQRPCIACGEWIEAGVVLHGDECEETRTCAPVRLSLAAAKERPDGTWSETHFEPLTQGEVTALAPLVARWEGEIAPPTRRAS